MTPFCTEDCRCEKKKQKFKEILLTLWIKLELPSSPLSNSIVVFFFPVGLSSLSQYFQQVFLGVEVSSTSKKTCWKCCDNNKRPTGKNYWMGQRWKR